MIKFVLNNEILSLFEPLNDQVFNKIFLDFVSIGSFFSAFCIQKFFNKFFCVYNLKNKRIYKAKQRKFEKEIFLSKHWIKVHFSFWFFKWIILGIFYVNGGNFDSKIISEKREWINKNKRGNEKIWKKILLGNTLTIFFCVFPFLLLLCFDWFFDFCFSLNFFQKIRVWDTVKISKFSGKYPNFEKRFLQHIIGEFLQILRLITVKNRGY